MHGTWTDTVDHAASRWARAVMLVTPESEDVPTLLMWARTSHSSVGALRAVCRAAHTPAKSSLDFARLLRAVLRGQYVNEWDLANLLNVRHERTLARLIGQGGLSHAVKVRRAPELAEFLTAQGFVHAAANLRAINSELIARHRNRLPPPAARVAHAHAS